MGKTCNLALQWEVLCPKLYPTRFLAAAVVGFGPIGTIEVTFIEHSPGGARG